MCENRQGQELMQMGNGETGNCDKVGIGNNVIAKRAPGNGKNVKTNRAENRYEWQNGKADKFDKMAK